MDGWLNHIGNSVHHILPECTLAIGFLLLIVLGLFRVKTIWLAGVTIIIFGIALSLVGIASFAQPFAGLLVVDSLSNYFKILIDIAGLLTILIGWRSITQHRSEYFALILSLSLGAHLLCMTTHGLLVFISLEIVSISGYILVGYSFDRTATEGTMKYFLFGAVSSAVMLYGLSFFYGLTGTMDFTTQAFFDALLDHQSPLFSIAAFFVLAGFLFKIAAFPMHLWAPDAYASAPLPIVAYLSAAPKLAGFAVLVKFILAVNLYGQSILDWQSILAIIAMVTITVGNFSALYQKTVKRLMAYSSIAHSGFLLIGIIALLPQGISSLLFYATVYLFANFAAFFSFEIFENNGITTIAAFEGYGRKWFLPSFLLLVALISLVGLPPTSGFTAKLLIFSTLWESFQASNNTILLALLVFGLLNTVVSLFYYLRIPYYAYLKNGQAIDPQNIVTVQNFLSLILVLAVLILFFQPQLLMGWINKINFVH